MLDQQILSEYNKIRKTENKEIFCHAPFTNMNFEQNGNVTVCCYNRKHILGTYPKASLNDMWYGEKADQLRRYMKSNVLPKGCEICNMQFQSKNFGGLRANAFDSLAEKMYPESEGRLISMPKMLEFEISNICNLECTMCNGFFSSLIRRNRENLPPLNSPYDEFFVKQLEPFIPHLKEAKFLGGEPFLIKTYYQIWNLIIQLNPNIKVSITTNGTILNDRIKHILEKMNTDIIISIDSLEKENYERIRINAKFDLVMGILRYFRDYVTRKRTTLSIATCPMQQNWKEMPYFLRFCNEQGIYLYFNTVTWPEDHSLETMSQDELSKIVKFLRPVILIENTDVHRYNNSNYRDLIRQISYWRDNSSKKGTEMDRWRIKWVREVAKKFIFGNFRDSSKGLRKQ
jgi:MoaA/NifB/PqqE/SkfB family radical SAM enzyme